MGSIPIRSTNLGNNMVRTVSETIFQNGIEKILEKYLMSTSYPEGCKVKLEIVDESVIAHITPSTENISSYMTTTVGKPITINYNK